MDAMFDWLPPRTHGLMVKWRAPNTTVMVSARKSCAPVRIADGLALAARRSLARLDWFAFVESRSTRQRQANGIIAKAHTARGFHRAAAAEFSRANRRPPGAAPEDGAPMSSPGGSA